VAGDEDAYSELIPGGLGMRESRKSRAFCANRAIVLCDGDHCIHQNVCEDVRQEQSHFKISSAARGVHPRKNLDQGASFILKLRCALAFFGGIT
jgi:hypothetical protein